MASRRNSEKIIAEGRITINGSVVSALGTKVDPNKDIVCLDGKVLQLPTEAHTFKLNKPTGYLTSMSDPFGRKCVSELIPLDRYPSLYPIGRLDYDTSGLLLFTTDGELGNNLAHPSKHIDKTYIALVSDHPKKSSLDKLRAGISLNGEKCAPAQCEIIKNYDTSSKISITIHEGKNRQVRRMFSFIGHEVIELQRVSIGPIKLDDLELGKCEELSELEHEILMQAISKH